MENRVEKPHWPSGPSGERNLKVREKEWKRVRNLITEYGGNAADIVEAALNALQESQTSTPYAVAPRSKMTKEEHRLVRHLLKVLRSNSRYGYAIKYNIEMARYALHTGGHYSDQEMGEVLDALIDAEEAEDEEEEGQHHSGVDKENSGS